MLYLFRYLYATDTILFSKVLISLKNALCDKMRGFFKTAIFHSLVLRIW